LIQINHGWLDEWKMDGRWVDEWKMNGKWMNRG